MLIFLVASAHANLLSCDTSAEQRNASLDATLRTLTSAGYTVREGTFHVFNSTSFGANPGNPYVTYFLPGPPYALLAYLKYPVFKLVDARDAILFVGCTPPATRYFSFRSYLFSEGASFPLVPLFASLGDSVNNLVINTTGGSDTVHNHTTAVVTTGDSTTYDAVASALSKAGMGGATNLDGFSPSNIPDVDKATFLMLHRASIWSSVAQKRAYFDQPPRRIFRISAPNGIAPRPMPPIPNRMRGTGRPEAKAVPHFDASLAALRTGIFDTMRAVGLSPLGKVENTTNYPIYGLECIKDRNTHHTAPSIVA